MQLIQKIDELTFSHADGRRDIGQFLLRERSGVKDYSMQEIADRTYTSKSSLVRFAKALGYSGWKEFLKDFLSEMHYEDSHYTDIDPNFPFAQGSTTQEIMQRMANLAVESILDTADQLDIHQLRRATDMLLKANHIAILGQSPNTTVARLFRRKMLTIGCNIQMSDGDQGLLANTLAEGDCAILISYSGNNEQRMPMNFLSILKENKVSIIAITGLGDNLLRRKVSCVLTMSSRERLYTKISTFATEESLNFILNILYAGYFARNYEKNLEYKVDKSRKLEEMRFSDYHEIREQEEKESKD